MILVTGGTGLLGSHLLMALVREHEEVLAVKRPSSNLEEVRKVFRRHTPPKEAEEHFRLIDWVDADLLDYHETERLLIDVDRVFHCAGMVSFSGRDRQAMMDFNVGSTRNLVNAILEVGGSSDPGGKVRLLHVSSTSAIGRAPAGEKAHEGLIWADGKDHTAYSISKFRSEMEVWRGIEEGLEAVIVNPAIILGAGFWDGGSSSLFSRVAGGMRMSTPGMTGYVGVNDVVEAMCRLMDSKLSAQRYILSEGDYRYSEVMEMIASALGKPAAMKHIGPRMLLNLARLDGFREWLTGRRILTTEQAVAAFHTSRFSNEKICRETGFRFTPVERVVRKVASHYLEEH